MEVKGLAWIGNIYDKFEAMCLEMEEVMYEDTVKYVENQVHTVGSTVKRFYSDVMQDLHPESYNDPVKVAAADLSLKPYTHSERKLKASSKKDGRETDWKLSDETKVISGKANSGVYRRPTANRRGSSKGYLDPLPSATIDPISETKNKFSSFSQLKSSSEGACGHVVTPSAPFEGISKNRNGNFKSVVDSVLPSVNSPVPTGTTVRTEQKQADSFTRVDTLDTAATLRLATSAGSKNSDSPATLGSTASGLMKADYASTSGNFLDTKTILPATKTELKQADFAGALSLETSGTCGFDSQAQGGAVHDSMDSRKSSGADAILVHQGRLEGCSEDAAKNIDALDADVEIIEPFNDSMLAESCVIVGDDETHLIPQGKGSRKSYKKKLREAFSSKKRLTRKEYKDLAAKYTVEECNQGSTAEKDEAEPVVLSGSSESDWELL